MKKITNMIMAGLLLAQSVYAEDKKPNSISANINAGIISKNILISGIPQSQHPMMQYAGSINFKSVKAFTGIHHDQDEVREFDLGISYQLGKKTSIGKARFGSALERKSLPDQDKNLWIADASAGLNGTFGDLGFLFRSRLGTRDFDSGRTLLLSYATPNINAITIKNNPVKVNVGVSTVYQDRFVGKTSELGYVTPSLNFSYKRGNTSVYLYLRNQFATRPELKNQFYGSARLNYDFRKR